MSLSQRVLARRIAMRKKDERKKTRTGHGEGGSISREAIQPSNNANNAPPPAPSTTTDVTRLPPLGKRIRKLSDSAADDSNRPLSRPTRSANRSPPPPRLSTALLDKSTSQPPLSDNDSISEDSSDSEEEKRLLVQLQLSKNLERKITELKERLHATQQQSLEKGSEIRALQEHEEDLLDHLNQNANQLKRLEETYNEGRAHNSQLEKKCHELVRNCEHAGLKIKQLETELLDLEQAKKSAEQALGEARDLLSVQDVGDLNLAIQALKDLNEAIDDYSFELFNAIPDKNRSLPLSNTLLQHLVGDQQSSDFPGIRNEGEGPHWGKYAKPPSTEL